MRYLILDYLTDVEGCLNAFELAFGRRDVVQAAAERAIPKSGELPGGAKYKVHGFGCLVALATHEVDFDFANERDVGFDAWRLWLYAEEFPDRYPDYQDRSVIEARLVEMAAAGEAKSFEERPNLFWLDATVRP